MIKKPDKITDKNKQRIFKEVYIMCVMDESTMKDLYDESYELLERLGEYFHIDEVRAVHKDFIDNYSKGEESIIPLPYSPFNVVTMKDMIKYLEMVIENYEEIVEDYDGNEGEYERKKYYD